MINLSVNGTILLSAMAGFACVCHHGQPGSGLPGGQLVGALVALMVAFSSITLKQSQVAVGFVLTLMCRDLSYFLGNPFMGLSGPRVPSLPIPGLSDIPVLGTLFFRQDLMIYLSFLLIIVAWIFILQDPPRPDAAGHRRAPAAAFVRGANVNRLRYFYTVLGGALVGLAGPMYSLERQGRLERHHLRAWMASAGSRWRSRSSAAGTRCGRRLAPISLLCCSGWGWSCSPACRVSHRRCCR